MTSKVVIVFLIFLMNHMPVFLQTLKPEQSSSDLCPIPINTQLGIRDVLAEICSHLTMKDLRNCREICRDFRDAVRDQLNRAGPVIRIVNIDDYNDETPPFKQPKLDQQQPDHSIQNVIGFKPAMSLFFYDRRWLGMNVYTSASHEIIANYIFDLLRDSPAAVVGAANVLFNNMFVVSQYNSAIGIFLPERPTVQIRYQTITCHIQDDGSAKIAVGKAPLSEIQTVEEWVTNPESKNLLMDVFLPSNMKELENQPFAIIVLANRPYTGSEDDDKNFRVIREVMESGLKSVYNDYPRHFSLWGGVIDNLGSWGMRSDAAFTVDWLIFSISGPGVKSWSLIIENNKPNTEIHHRLIEFKKKISIKPKQTIALSITLPSVMLNHDNLQGITNFREVFPNVNLMTVIQSKNYPEFCLDSTNEKLEQSPDVTFDGYFTCYLIITYT